MSVSLSRVTAQMFSRPLRRDEMLPEFRAVRRNPERLAKCSAARQVLRLCDKIAADLEPIPVLTYSLEREYDRIGVRRNFDNVYHARRRNLAAAALLAIFRRERRWIDLVQDYVWAICEETNWVPPEHLFSHPIDLFSAETAFELAEAAHVLHGELDDAVAGRIRDEVERRILAPYLDPSFKPGWSGGHNNWSGVCHAATAAAFLYLERDPARLARAINKALAGLELFIARAFLGDGGSSEGAGYWQYGLINMVDFAELLRRRTGGAVDLLAHPKLRKIARYPLASCVAPGIAYSCSDCSGAARFAPGFVSMLAERTGVAELKSVLSRAGIGLSLSRFSWALRDILWWDGRARRPARIDDCLLPATAVARLVCPGRRLVLMAKAGDNAENHNHNDVGSFAVYLGGEPILCDPGTGLYDKAYFGPKRYENPVCNSWGHSVPAVGGKLQKAGKEFAGRIVRFDATGAAKQLVIEFAGAYGLRRLSKLERTLSVTARGPDAGYVRLEDRFAMTGAPVELEEAFVTWGTVSVRGGTARVRGANATLRLAVIEPRGTAFRVEELPVRLAHSPEPKTLRRIACTLPPGAARFVMEMRPAS